MDFIFNLLSTERVFQMVLLTILTIIMILSVSESKVAILHAKILHQYHVIGRQNVNLVITVLFKTLNMNGINYL